MDRRSFLALAAGAWLMRGADPRLRLPETDFHYRKVRTYIEEEPIAAYNHAPASAYESFRDIKYGVRLHWGAYSIEGLRGESWPFLQMSFAERQRYQSLYRLWNPTGFDADEWTDLFVQCGLKMFAFTSKHHDGFSMFDTRTRVRQRANWTAPGGPKIERCDLAYSITETPFRRDVVKELTDAAHKRGLKVDLYFSHPDWYDADFRPYAYHPLQTASSATLTTDYDEVRKRLGDRMVIVPDPSPEEVKRMMARHRAQLTELLTRYGRIDMLCLDQWLGPAVWPMLRDTILHLRKLQPDVMLRARGIGNYGDYYTPEGFVPGNKENTDMPWFVIYPLGSSFSYERDAAKYKGAPWIISNLVDAVAKGGNFMVGIGPDPDGQFHPAAVQQLKDAGTWLRVNGEGIYATRPREDALWKEGDDIRFTRSKDGGTVWAFALKWPGRQLVLTSVEPQPDSEVRMLGHASSLAWRKDSARGVVISLPEELQDPARRPCDVAWCFRFSIRQ